ncbi:MAG: DUF86 domain-containing protein [Actinobacteria bacterium]|nr:DUF86 domain-containing protein [Actinomycetota bacterium]
MRGDAERLTDMLQAAARIEEQAAQGRERFFRDEIVQLALVHLVQIIGEAASKLSADVRQRHQQVPWRQVIGMRNRVVHDYFEVDLDILWEVVSSDVPKLRVQLTAMVDEEG